MNVEFMFMMILPRALLGILLHALPLLSRREIFFGVTVPPGYVSSGDARRILFRYRAQIWGASLVALVMHWMGTIQHSTLLLGTNLLVPVCVSFVAWAQAHKQVRPHAEPVSSVRVASLSPRDEPFPGGMLVALGPVLLLLGAACILYLQWDLIPERFPVHWGWDGTPNRWSNRTVSGVFAPLLVGLCTIAVTLAPGYWMLRMTRQVRAQGAGAANERTFKRATVWILLAASYGIAFLTAGISLWPLVGDSFNAGSHPRLLNALPLVLIAGLILILVRMGQGGSRLPGGASADDQMGDSTPDQCWKWGQIYYNPDDPALLVEKRMGIGWTLNFGRRASWLVLAAALILPLLPLLLR